MFENDHLEFARTEEAKPPAEVRIFCTKLLKEAAVVKVFTKKKPLHTRRANYPHISRVDWVGYV